jgi:6-phospho-beta-glucosidase
MPVVTLAVLGGSSVATPALVAALQDWVGSGEASEARPELHIVLLGRSAEKLECVRGVCEQMTRDARTAISIEATTDLRAGLRGADFVLNQMRVGGLEARARDETFPQALGYPGEETVGPGGFANALRTIPVVNEALRLVSEVAPRAIVLNLTNPASIVQRAATHYTGARVISLCDSPITLGNELAALVERSRSDLQVGYLGMNHLGWVVSLSDGERDLMDVALERIERLSSLGVDASYTRASRAIPIPYVRYYLFPERMLAQQQGKTPRARQLQALEQELLAAYNADAPDASAVVKAVAKRGAVWYSAIIVPTLAALVQNHPGAWIASVANEGLIPWLPPETVIEAPCSIDGQGAHRLPVQSDLLPAELRALLTSLALYEELAAPAIVEQNRALAQRALIAHPLVRTVERAERVLDAVWPTGGI